MATESLAVVLDWLFADEWTREDVLHALDLLGKGDRDAFRALVPGPG